MRVGSPAAAGAAPAEGQERREEDEDAEDDEAVREVERRPEAEVDEVGHVPEPDAIDEVRGAAADQRPSAIGRIGCRAPERAKKSSIQPTATAVSAVTIGVALAKSPKAIPEFWTWWIESGPTT